MKLRRDRDGASLPFNRHVVDLEGELLDPFIVVVGPRSGLVPAPGGRAVGISARRADALADDTGREAQQPPA